MREVHESFGGRDTRRWQVQSVKEESLQTTAQVAVSLVDSDFNLKVFDS